MFNKYNLKSKFETVQDAMIFNSIKDASNLQLLRSEEAIRNLIKSYADKFNAAGGKITNMAKHMAVEGNIIDVKQFNNLFESLYIDLMALYKDIESVDTLLNINLNRNVKFYSLMKRRMRDLWNKLQLIKLNIYNESAVDVTYFESFSSYSDEYIYSNMLIDKKVGTLQLAPFSKIIHNENYLIKNIATKTFPVHNIDGGVQFFSSELNSYDHNYSIGQPRDMLIQGLWKEQVICNEMPEILYNLTEEADNVINKVIQGILSFVDIEFTYPVEINNFDFDVFGEFPMKVVMILYKAKSTDKWKPIVKYKYTEDQTIDDLDEIENFDVVSIKNIELIKAEKLRIVFNQRHFEVLDQPPNESDLTGDKINQDFAERRYELLKINYNNDDVPLKPKTNDISSLYDSVLSMVEDTKTIGDALVGIIDILDPPAKIINTQLKKLFKYELGLWALEPSLQKFSGAPGKLDSNNYQLLNKPMISISITSKQETPELCTCNWFVSSPTKNDVSIPILHSTETLRREPINFVQVPSLIRRGWTKGSFIQTDFPVDFNKAGNIKIFVNGTEYALTDLDYYFFNSRILYFDKLVDSSKYSFVVEYTPDINTSVNVYSLIQLQPDGLDYHTLLTASRREFLNSVLYDDGLSNYNIRRTICTKVEYTHLFGDKFDKHIACNPLFPLSMRPIYLSCNLLTRPKDTLDYSSFEANTGYDGSPLIPTEYERII